LGYFYNHRGAENAEVTQRKKLDPHLTVLSTFP